MLKSLLNIFILGLAAQNAKGLEVFLDLDVKVLPGDQQTCGVLHCLEKGKEPRLSLIREMTVFKSSTGVGTESRRRRAVASLSERQPVVSTLWDGIKVDGTWSKQEAELTLYLVEKDDCRLAEFSCEVHYVDGYQEERVSFAQLGRRHTESAGTHSSSEESCTTTTNLMQLSSLLQQSSSTIQITTTQLQGRLEDKVRDLENRLEDKISALDVSLARIAGGNPTVEGSIDESLTSLKAVTDKLLSIVERPGGLEEDDTSGTEEGTRLVWQTTCERREGNYQMVVPNGGDAPYLCDIQTEGGGWIVIQRRSTGNVDFYRNWSTYKKGFGSLADDFWLGNDKIHALTSSGSYELMVNLRYGNVSAFARYQTFSIGDEASKYVLHLGRYDGTAGDALAGHKEMHFSTYDRDYDAHNTSSCAVVYRGAWWYNRCHASNLNGEWGASNYRGPRWSTLSGAEPVDFSEMKIRKLS
ncbi:ficolin-1 [Elysia marginata]|uniref:Ficolin-1 n=1 Tax=Elysia marginata TaxID=1093978 RepID=A0AAV4GNF1_9GAST|nr:ficolin-1 [Elysia marginata]